MSFFVAAGRREFLIEDFALIVIVVFALTSRSTNLFATSSRPTLIVVACFEFYSRVPLILPLLLRAMDPLRGL